MQTEIWLPLTIWMKYLNQIVLYEDTIKIFQ